MKLHYIKPAEKWVEALPLGNGRLGGMVFGGVRHDCIQINEETLWSGWFDEFADNPETIEHLDAIRSAIFSGDYAKGEQLTQKYMVCRGVGSGGSRDGAYGSYQTAGELHIDFPGISEDAIIYCGRCETHGFCICFVYGRSTGRALCRGKAI